MTRYGLTAYQTTCGESSKNNSEKAQEFLLTTILYGIASVLRFLEYVVLGKQFYSFLFKQNVVNTSRIFTGHFNHCLCPVLFFFIMPYFLLGLTIPAFGMYQEIQHSQQVTKYYYEDKVYITYSAINLLRYICAFTVRVLMILSTLAIRKDWKDAEDPQEPAGLITEEEKFLEDWKYVSSDYKKRMHKYQDIGKKVNEIEKLFQAWFIIPWIIYLIASSLKTYNILRPWKLKDYNDIPASDVYYLLYNINQFITLLIPYICARAMNSYHHDYYKHMREHQLNRFRDDPSRFSMARQLLIEKNTIKFDFIPRIPGTSITINVGNPLYIILLLTGLFLSVAKSLLYNNT